MGPTYLQGPGLTRLLWLRGPPRGSEPPGIACLCRLLPERISALLSPVPASTHRGQGLRALSSDSAVQVEFKHRKVPPLKAVLQIFGYV